VFAGQARPDEAIESAPGLQTAALTHARNLHLFNRRFYLCWQSGLLRWLQSWQPDVLIVEANLRYLHTPAAVRWMHARRRPVLGWGLGAPAESSRGLSSSLRRAFLSQFDALITYSQQGAREYAAAGFRAERVFVAPNAAAARPLEAPPARGPEFSEQGPVILFVGRLQARKRLDLLLQACAGLGSAPAPRLWIVGDGPERASLETLARQLYPQTQFFGARHGPDLKALFEAADLFVLPGTGGLAVQQAMSFALPVLVGEADGTQSDLVRPANGWNLTPGDPRALADALRLALADPARLRRMGRESYRIVAEEINLERMVQVFAQAIRVVWKGS
jgi:glycosyltransferase involved in cell wall biosynthesis